MISSPAFGSLDHSQRNKMVDLKKAVRSVQNHYQVFSDRAGARPSKSRTQEFKEDDEW